MPQPFELYHGLTFNQYLTHQFQDLTEPSMRGSMEDRDVVKTAIRKSVVFFEFQN